MAPKKPIHYERKIKQSRKFRTEFKKFLQEERSSKAGLKQEECPKLTTQRGYESTASGSYCDVNYLLRLAMWFHEKADYLSSSKRLKKLLLLWILGKLEKAPEENSFRLEVASDHYDDPSMDEANAIFDEKWELHGKPVQNHVNSALRELLTSIDTQSDPSEYEMSTRLPTLDFFPEAFEPLTVIVGGYSGDIPKDPEHIYELFRQSQSMVNLHYLPRLGLSRETRIISDQLFIEQNDKDRAKILGNSHLLVIGGPLVNAVARHLALTKQLVFNFSFTELTYRWSKVYDLFVDSKLFDKSSAVRMFAEMLKMHQDDIDVTSEKFASFGIPLEKRDEIKNFLLMIRGLMNSLGADNKDILERFRPKEMFTPLKSDLISTSSDTHREYAIISLGENPWGTLLKEVDSQHPSYTAVVVAGINENSTTLALKALSSRGNFKMRPCGGILEVSEPSSSNTGVDRVENSDYKWVTSEYDLDGLLDSLKRSSASFGGRANSFKLFSEDEMRNYQSLIRKFIDE